MPELKMYRELAAQYFPNNVKQPHEYSMQNYNNNFYKGGNGGPPDGIIWLSEFQTPVYMMCIWKSQPNYCCSRLNLIKY